MGLPSDLPMTSEANECIGSWFIVESVVGQASHSDHGKIHRSGARPDPAKIVDTADAIIARAAAIPIGDEPPYSLEVALADAADRLRRVEMDLDNLTEDDTRNGN
jgi:hypothetical protein